MIARKEVSCSVGSRTALHSGVMEYQATRLTNHSHGFAHKQVLSVRTGNMCLKCSDACQQWQGNGDKSMTVVARGAERLGQLSVGCGGPTSDLSRMRLKSTLAARKFNLASLE